MSDTLKLLPAFRSRVSGQIVRGQKIGDVELIAEVHEQDDLRLFLNLRFVEKKFAYEPGMSKEEKLLVRIYDETPKYAWRRFTAEELHSLLNGDTQIGDYQWILEDEHGFGQIGGAA